MPCKSVESAAPRTTIESKGKAVVESPENPKKKRKLVKALEVEPKKAKLMSSAMPPATVIEVTEESSPMFAMVPRDPKQAMEVQRKDSGEVEEEGEVDLPLTVLRPFEHGSEPTPSDVVVGVLNQLASVEGMARPEEIEAIADEGQDKAVNHPVSPLELEPSREEEVVSSLLLEQALEPIEEVGPSSPP